MIIAGAVKDLMAAVHTTAGAQYTGASLAVVRLEQDGDADDGKFWDGAAWQAVLAAPAGAHVEAGQHLYLLPAAATTGRVGATIHFTFTDNVVEASATTVCGGGEHTVRSVVEGLTVAQGSDVSTILGDTNDIQTRLPAALIGGRMDSDVAVIQTGAITAAAFAASGLQAIVDAVLDEVASSHVAAGSVGARIFAAGGYAGLYVLLDGGAGVANAQYNANNQMTDGRLRFFDDNTNMLAATPGNAGLETGEAFTVNIISGDMVPALGNASAVPAVVSQLVRRGP